MHSEFNSIEMKGWRVSKCQAELGKKKRRTLWGWGQWMINGTVEHTELFLKF